MNNQNSGSGDQDHPDAVRRFPWYTGKGDDGTTQLLGQERVPKYSAQPDTYGTLDEATSALGLARALSTNSNVSDTIMEVQRHLYRIMSELASTMSNREKYRFTEQSHVDWLSERTNFFGDLTDMPRDFVIPGDTAAGGALDLARAVVRRTERMVLRAGADGLVTNRNIACYLNRLSSLCYVMARYQDSSSDGKT